MVDEQILSKTKSGQQKAERLKAVRAKELQLEKQVDAGRVAVVNVRTDYRARAGTLQFAQYST